MAHATRTFAINMALTQEEAEYLRDILRNSPYAPSEDPEPVIERGLRSEIFHALDSTLRAGKGG